MNRWIAFTSLAAIGVFSTSLFSAPRTAPDAAFIKKVTDEIVVQGQAFLNLKSLTAAGPRLCGSEGATRGVEWAKAKLESYGLDRVWLQPVSVPAWTRGTREKAAIISTATPIPLRVTALGNSAGTPSGGVEGEVVEVKSLEEAKRLGSQLHGKIVFFNRPMDPGLADTFEAYSQAVDQRSAGPSLASQLGAVATLVRTMTTLTDDSHPHTGATRFRNGTSPIPAAAISTHDAGILSSLLQSNKSVRVRLELSAGRNPDTTSYNVIGELTGSEIPREIVAVGGHLDSWDLSPGAHDDGAGVVQSIEVLRAFKALGLQPRRTVRVVLFMCEELGGIGGYEYARQARLRGETHIAATESDRGGYQATGFAVQSSHSRAFDTAREWAPYLAPIHANAIEEGEGGTDVYPLVEQGTATFGLLSDSKHYFDLHHSELDQLSAVDPQQLASGAAAMAILTYLVADQGI